jgi:hypothetical protein
VIATEETETREVHAAENVESESQFAWEFRVMAVSTVWMLPGTLLGVLVRLWVPDGGPAEWWLIGGGLLGAFFGSTVEADHWTG